MKSYTSVFFSVLFIVFFSCGENTNTGSSSSVKNTGIWETRGILYCYSDSNISMAVDPSRGARITSFKIEGTEQLHTSGDMSGSTFWPAPQSMWDWPPPEEIDSKQYQLVSNEGSTLILESSRDSRTGFQVRKEFTGTGEDIITVTYIIINRDSRQKNVAPWEITRVPPHGLSFFPKGEAYTGSSTLTPTREDQIVWFRHNGEHDQKLFRDGSQRWIAHLNGSFVLIKEYQTDIPVSSFAPEESEIEIYSAAGYVEIEQQGAYEPLRPGESLSWSVEWSGIRLPWDVSGEAGSTGLVEHVRDLLEM